MDRKTMDLWVGIFVIAGVLALGLLAFKVGNLAGESGVKTFKVEARFDNIGGLKLKAPVKGSGVLVGRVADIHFDNVKFQAVVTLALDKRYQFPKDTSASILTSGLLGEVYIGLDAGGDDKNLQEGDKLILTQSAVVLERLIGQFMFDKAAEGNSGKVAEGNSSKAAKGNSGKSK
jgi:phospholipid/cholesterol/gamma-HCH transport system substrate-binding protein